MFPSLQGVGLDNIQVILRNHKKLQTSYNCYISSCNHFNYGYLFYRLFRWYDQTTIANIIMKKLFESFKSDTPFTISDVLSEAIQQHKQTDAVTPTEIVMTKSPVVEDMVKMYEPSPIDIAEVMRAVKLCKLLTTSVRKTKIDIDHLLFKPSVSTYLSGKSFKAVYKRQLNQHILDAQDKGEPEALLSLSQIFAEAVKHSDGVQLTSKAYKRKLTDVIQVLNEFFRINSFILYSTCGMLGEKPELNIPKIQVPSTVIDVAPDTEYTLTHE